MSSCPAVDCQFVKYTKNQDYSWMQVTLVLVVNLVTVVMVMVITVMVG